MTTPDYTEWLKEAKRLVRKLRGAVSLTSAAIENELLSHLRRHPVATVRMLTREEIERSCGFGVTSTAREWDMIDRAIAIFCEVHNLTLPNGAGQPDPSHFPAQSSGASTTRKD